jgi:ribonuclease D
MPSSPRRPAGWSAFAVPAPLKGETFLEIGMLKLHCRQSLCRRALRGPGMVASRCLTKSPGGHADQRRERYWSMNKMVSVYRGDLPEEVAVALTAQPMIACDIETSGLDWRSDKIGTVQFYGSNIGTALVYQLTDRPTHVIDLVEADTVVKVFHHAPFDLRFMAAAWSVQSRSVQCTKIASKLAQPGLPPLEHSLAALLTAHLGVTVAKGSVRTSDWTAGSISTEQLAYAANDVRYLLPLLVRLRSLLAQVERETLFTACCEFLPTQTALEVGRFPDVFSY